MLPFRHARPPSSASPNVPPAIDSPGFKGASCPRSLGLRLSQPGQPSIDSIGFGLGSRLSDLPEVIDVAHELTVNEWNGSRTAQLSLQDVRGAD